ncbi:Ldh family oxidoreductase [Marispirochaeta sp.]|uniref:Ldh family oxidoreductase n=1 Tax=Marispirochaeta sp. TaxID=2038653 RepID=UPI0029C846E3|nr:Ldh family oxidoreductase [Marispirochaeta sp.]
MVSINEDELKKLVIRRLVEVDIPQKDAEVIADVLVFADLRGVHSHGVLRVEHYVRRIKSGGMNCNPELKVEMLKPSIGLVDAQGGAGHVTTRFAAAEAIKVAQQEGICMMGVRNNSHCGALAYYVQMALNAKMSAMVMVNTDACVVPFGGRQAFFGTNPFAFGFPGSKESILLDMATSEVAFGKIFYAREKEQPIPEHWAVDAQGNPTTDPNMAKSLFPFGGAKGYGINILVEALTGLMIGGVFGPHLTKMYGDFETYRDLSNFILIINPAVFGDDDYLETSQKMIDELHSQAPAPGFSKVMIPGEIESQAMEKSRRDGISIPQGVYEYLAG